MLRFIKKLVFVSLVAMAAPSAHAFSLMGQFTAWMDDVKGYTGYTLKGSGNIGGPMNLGEEYRWNTPVVTYGFDESFLNYFGQEGVRAVELAVKMINDLPPMSEVTDEVLMKYPLNTMRRNYRASALTLLDMKSSALHLLIEELGLAQAEEWTYTVREEWHDDATPYNPYFIVIKRNFDPITRNPSSYVNGTLYSYQLYHSENPHLGLTRIYSPDPLAAAFTSVSGGYIGQGMFYSGLTRDDVGGLRYLYRPLNANVEGVVPFTTRSTNQSILLNTGTVWTPVGTTNIIPGAVPTGSPWYPINYTNIVFGNTNAITVTNAATVADPTGTNVLASLRPGVDKIRLFRVNYDSLLGQLAQPITNLYVDTFISNNITRHQILERVVTRPDIVFGAQDLSVGTTHYPFEWRRSSNFINNDGLNGDLVLDGPGIIQLPINIIFSKIGPWIENGPGYMTETTGFQYFIWGHFDGSTNDPVVFPQGWSVQDLEQQVLGY